MKIEFLNKAFFSFIVIATSVQAQTQDTKVDEGGNVLSVKDARGKFTCSQYDLLGRLLQAQYQSGTSSNMKVARASSIMFDYDDAHRLRSVANSAGNSTSYALDTRGYRAIETVSDGSGNLHRQIFRVFDGLNRLRQMTGGGAMTTPVWRTEFAHGTSETAVNRLQQQTGAAQ